MITSTYVNTGGLGRLGNTMFTIAGTIGIAIKNNQEYAFPEWVIKDNELFGGKADRMEDYFLNPLPRLTEDASNYQKSEYHWEYRPYRVRGNWNMFNHFQSEKYFSHCSDLIRHYFTLKDEQPQNEFIAVHIRRTDYDNHFHPRIGSEYYREAIKHFPNERFVIFSDDPKEAYSVMKDSGCENFSIHNGQHYMDDFGFMKSCKSFIIANSTFSWWAAWLGNHPEKKVIAPKKWFGDFYLKSDDIYAGGWTVI